MKNYVKAAELFEAIPALIVPIRSPRLNLTAMHSGLLQGEAEATDGLRGRLCPRDVALAHIAELCALTPLPTISSPLITSPESALSSATSATMSTDPPPDLDTPDELAIRALLLGILHRTAGEYDAARAFLADAFGRQAAVKVSTWVGSVTLFELAVLELREAQARTEGVPGLAVGEEREELSGAERRAMWERALKEAEGRLEKALALSTQQVDLSSRLDSRIAMLRDEMVMKREMLAASA